MAAVSKSLTKDDLGCVVEALTPVKHKWEVIGLQIGVRSNVLEAIKLEHSRNPGPCLLAVLKEHLSKIDPQPCWEGFVKALRSESVGETAFAEALLLKFCPNEPLSDVQSPECSTSDDVTSPVSTSASEQNQFPFLKLPAEMSEDARETLYGRLSTEHREMQRKFQRLVTTTRKGVAEKGVTPEQLSDEICCQTYESQIEKVSKKLLSDSQEEIRKSKSINDAFFLMRNHYSFFNYELIEEIITIFDLDRSHLSAFEEELRRFCERRVHEFPAKAYGTAMSTDSKLTVVLDSEFDKYTMNSLRSFRHRLGKIFKVSSAVIRLIEVFEGSIEIVFAISSSLVNQILPLSEEQEKSLRDEGVKRFEFTHHPNSFMAKPKGPVPTTPADSGEQLAETTATRDDSGIVYLDQEERITSGKLRLKVQLGDAAAKSELLEAQLAEWKARCAKIEDDRTRLSEELKQAESKIAHLEEEQQALQGEMGAADTVATTKTEVEQEKRSVQVQLEEVTAKAEQLQAELNVTKSKCYELQRKNEEMGKLHLKVQLGDVSAKSELLEAQLAEWKARCLKLEDGLTQLSEELKQSEARFKDVLETIDDQFAVRVQSEEDEGKKLLSEKLKELDILRKLSTELAEKLEFVKLEADTYKEDFETERREREGIASAMVEQKAKMELQYQDLKEECDTTLQANVTVSEREDQKREISALRSQSEDQQQQYDTLRSEADTLKQRVTNLRAQLYKRLEEIEQLHQEIKHLHQDHRDYLDYITAQQKSDMLNAKSDMRDLLKEKEQLKLEVEQLKKWMQQSGYIVEPVTGVPRPVPRKLHPPATDSVSMLSSRANQVSGPGRQQQYAKSTQQSVPILPVPRKRPPPAADTLTLSMLPSRANQGSGPGRQQYPPNYPPPDPYYPPKDPYEQGPQPPDQTQLPSQPRQAKSKYVTTQQHSLENLLSTGIDTDIHNIVAEFGGEYETSSNPNVPFDPNLVCPMCGLPFRIGQIQKFKTHVRNCKGASSSDSSHPQNAERPLADSRHQSDCHSKHPDSGFMSGMHSREYSSLHKHPDSGFMSGMHSQNISAEGDSRTHKSTK